MVLHFRQCSDGRPLRRHYAVCFCTGCISSWLQMRAQEDTLCAVTICMLRLAIADWLAGGVFTRMFISGLSDGGIMKIDMCGAVAVVNGGVPLLTM